MKIGFDAKRAFYNRAGLGNYSRNILTSLNRHFPENDYVLFTTGGKGEIFKEQEQFEIFLPETRFEKTFKSVWRSISIPELLSHQKINLYHGLTNELPSGLKKSKVKSIVTIHDLIFLRFPGYYKLIDRNIYRQKVKHACKVADRVIATSEQTKRDITAFLHTDPEKIDVVYQGIADRFYIENDDCFSLIKEKYALPDKYILSVGTIEKRKNQLNVLKGILDANVNIAYIMVGKYTPYVDEISAFAEKNDLKDRVLILNQVADDELPCFYRNAQLMAYISEFEGFGIPIVEAMAAGCPVITSNTSCMPETGGNAAIYCDPADFSAIGEAVNSVIRNPELRDNMIKKGKQRATDFTARITSGKLMDIYKKVLNDGK